MRRLMMSQFPIGFSRRDSSSAFLPARATQQSLAMMFPQKIVSKGSEKERVK